jgi:Tol biopolymer transport system component
MTAYDDFDRTLAGWFEADAQSPAPAGNLERVLDATRRRSPRRAWLAAPGSHWVGGAQGTGSSTGARSIPRMGLRWSTAFILLVIISALVGGTILVGGGLFSPLPVPVKPSVLPVEPSALPVKPSPPPTGHLGHLAYGLDGSIYVADWDGRHPVRIAKGVYDLGGAGPAGCGSFWGEGPMWSPDGRHLAYRSAWDASCQPTKGGGNVFISDPAGHVVASFPGTGWLVSWSPDSTRVATSVDLGKTFGIYGLDGVRQALLTVPPGYEVHGDYSPVWSPDGMSLLMPIAPASSSPSEIWELPIDGGSPRRVLDTDPRSHRGAAYSRDGARTAFIASDSASLVIAEADGTELQVLAGAENNPVSGPGYGVYYDNPVVSPTGDRVAFIWSQGDPYPRSLDPLPRPDELRVVDVASGAVMTLAIANGGEHLRATGFSAEGDRILFSRSDANYSGTALSSVRTDGSDSRLLVTGTDWGDWQTLPAGP